MSPKKTSKVCLVVLFVSVFCVYCFTFHETEETDYIVDRNKSVTQQYTQNTMQSSIQTAKKPNDANTPGVSEDIEVGNSFVEALDFVHKEWGGKYGFVYLRGGSGTYTFPDGNAATIRTDCSGFVSAGMYIMGWLPLEGLPGPASSARWENYGFVEVPKGDDGVYTFDDLQPGDLAVWPGSHVQVYVGPDDRWLNWGGESSAQNKYVGVTDIASVDSTSGNHRGLGYVKMYRHP